MAIFEKGKLKVLSEKGDADIDVEAGRVVLVADESLHGADHPHLVACGGQDAPAELAGGGFAVGAGDADGLKLASGIAVESGGQKSQGLAGVGDENVRNRDARLSLTDDGHRSPSNRIGNKIVAVGIEALDSHEEIVRPDLTRVLSQPVDFHIHALRQAQDSAPVDLLVR